MVVVEARSRAFETVGDQLFTVQIAAVLEFVHPLIGWVKTGLGPVAIQVFGRNFALFALIASEPKLQEQDVVWWLFVAWSSVEIVR